MQLPTIKILLTGNGKVAKGAMEMLDAMGIQKVSVEDYLSKSFNHVVYCQADVMDYNKRIDNNPGTMQEFFVAPKDYETNLTRFTHVMIFLLQATFMAMALLHFYKRQAASSVLILKLLPI